MPDAADGPDLALADAIEALRGELETAMVAGEGERLRFALGPVEMEFEVAISRERTAKGGIAFWVVTLGGEAGRTSATTHRVKLTLQPRAGAGGDVLVHDELEQRPG
jgi:Trypsin-co-occurring domain 2